MTNSETLDRPVVTQTLLGWLHSRNRLSNRLDVMFDVATRIDHQVRAVFTSQVKTARTRSSRDGYDHSYMVGWSEKIGDDGEVFGEFVVSTPRTLDADACEVLRFRLGSSLLPIVRDFAARPIEERQFILTRDFYTMDRWSLSFESADILLDVQFVYER